MATLHDARRTAVAHLWPGTWPLSQLATKTPTFSFAPIGEEKVFRKLNLRYFVSNELSGVTLALFQHCPRPNDSTRLAAIADGRIVRAHASQRASGTLDSAAAACVDTEQTKHAQLDWVGLGRCYTDPS